MILGVSRMNRPLARRTSSRADLIPDTDLFVIEADIVTQGRRERYFAERDAARTNRRDTLADILSGQIERVRRVLSFNPVEGWARDASEDIARDALCAALDDRQNVPDHLVDFLEEHLGCDTLATAERENAEREISRHETLAREVA
jgi:hypothetical protein